MLIVKIVLELASKVTQVTPFWNGRHALGPGNVYIYTVVVFLAVEGAVDSTNSNQWREFLISTGLKIFNIVYIKNVDLYKP